METNGRRRISLLYYISPRLIPNLGSRLVSLLDSIPAKTRKAAFVPLLLDKPWASEMLIRWCNDVNTPQAVKNAIAAKGGK